MIAAQIPTAPFVAAVIAFLGVSVAGLLAALVHADRLRDWSRALPLAAALIVSQWGRAAGRPRRYRGTHRMSWQMARALSRPERHVGATADAPPLTALMPQVGVLRDCGEDLTDIEMQAARMSAERAAREVDPDAETRWAALDAAIEACDEAVDRILARLANGDPMLVYRAWEATTPTEQYPVARVLDLLTRPCPLLDETTPRDETPVKPEPDGAPERELAEVAA